MKVELNGHLYQMESKQARQLLKVAREACPCAIVGLEKGGLLQMRRDSFSDAAALKSAAKDYRRKGYRVYTSE